MGHSKSFIFINKQLLMSRITERSILVFSGGTFIATIGAMVYIAWKNGRFKFMSLLPFSVAKNDLEVKERNVTISKRVKRGHPPGLINAGNTCFANCVLQALSSLSPFTEWVKEMKCYLEESNLTVVPSLCHMMEVLSNKKCLSSDVCATADVIESLQAHGWVIPGDQQDAHEFFQVLMSTVGEEIEKHRSSCIVPELLGDAIPSGYEGLVRQGLPVAVKSSPFDGLLASRLTCLSCGFQFPIKFEHFESLSLRIPNFCVGGVTVESCFRDFIRKEIVDEVSCPGCGGRRSSFSKQLSLAKLPKCLCLQIQRTYYQSIGTSYKNPSFVRFPEILDVSAFTYGSLVCKKRVYEAKQFPLPLLRGGQGHDVVPSDVKAKPGSSSKGIYTLKALVVHHGEVSDGHFVTYRRNINRHKMDWVYTSDTQIAKTTITDVLSSIGYLFFYERIDR